MASQEKLPWIIPELCVGCAECSSKCPLGLVQMTDSKKGTFIPWIFEPDKCAGCGLCARKCSYGALMMTAFTDEARERLKIRPF